MKAKLLVFISFLLISTYGIAQEHDSLAHYSIAQLDSIFQVLKKSTSTDLMLPYAEQAVSKAKQEYGDQDTLYARMLFNLGFVYDFDQEDYTRAMKYYKEALLIQEKKLPNSRDYTQTLLYISLTNQSLGENEEAVKKYLEIISIYENKLGKEHKTYFSTLNNLAALYWNIGDYKKSEKTYIKLISNGVNFVGKGNSTSAQWFNNLGLLYTDIAQYEKAEYYLKTAVGIRSKVLGKDNRSYIISLNNLAILYYHMGRYEDASSLFLEIVNTEEKINGKSQSYATYANNLAVLYQQIKRYQDAVTLIEEALEIEAKINGKIHSSYASTLVTLGAVYLGMKKYDKAESIYKEAIMIEKNTLGVSNPSYATTLYNLATMYHDTKRFEEAETLLLEIKDIRASVLGTSHPYYIGTLNSLATIYIKKGEYNIAWNLLNHVVRNLLGQDLSNVFHVDIISTIDGTTKYYPYSQLKQLLRSLRLVNDLLALRNVENYSHKQNILTDIAIQLLKKSRMNLSNSSDKLRELALANSWVLKYLKNTTKNFSKAFELIEGNKAVLLVEATKAARSEKMGILPDSLYKKSLILNRKHSELEAKLLEKRTSEEIDSIRHLLNEHSIKVEKFKERVDSLFPKYSKLKSLKIELSVDSLQLLLDKNTAFLEYAIGDSMIYIFYLDKTHIDVKKIPIDKKKLKYQIKSLHHILSNYDLLIKNKDLSYKEYTEHAHWFFKTLVAPALKNSVGIEHLIIVTDGELGHLPFESFLVEEAPANEQDYKKLHYLVNDYKISYNYSATLWKENKDSPKQKNNGQILAMAANYKITLDSSLLDVRLPAYQRLRKHLNPLPAAQKEVEVLKEEFNGFFGFNNQAGEAIFKEKAEEYGIIHLAMHGLLDKREPIMSSLAFTEDSDSNQNNFLHAYEISKMELNADLVVLSACETGYGKFETGNGIASLARAFMYAGAPSLIVSLWQVNDHATSVIMKKLYHNLADGLDKAEALRQAKLEYIKSAKGIMGHPAFWSPFIQMGDSSPITISKKRGILPWVIAGGVVLLLIAGIFLRRRKNLV